MAGAELGRGHASGHPLGGSMTDGWAVARHWPVPALLCWGMAWAAWLLLQRAGVAAEWAAVASMVGNFAVSLAVHRRWRQLMVALGFPLSMLLVAPGFGLPAWAWLGLLLALVGLYPVRAWRDAPWFPTPRGALRGLAQKTRLRGRSPPARILDAGCGQGAGLVELRAEFADAELVGIEWSRSLRLLCAWRCRWARVRRGDLWGESWADYDLVYMFQRPESLARALDKARREMRAGAWLVSLEFADQATPATTVLRRAGQRPLWLYRMPADGRRQRVER